MNKFQVTSQQKSGRFFKRSGMWRFFKEGNYEKKIEKEVDLSKVIN